ncbi:MAG: S-methyl-5-thioribose-1-phosphate isomerase [Planctomycetota bacterium]|nr:S-methyl-5-thioribose-1-phosphate isomerase [Planctomycetota bacterium]
MKEQTSPAPGNPPTFDQAHGRRLAAPDRAGFQGGVVGVDANIPRTMYFEDGRLFLLDQTRLPGETSYVACETPEEVIEAVRRLVVRGAPAIGCAGAHAVVLAAGRISAIDGASLISALRIAAEPIASARPTAANLRWAVDRMLRAVAGKEHLSPGGIRAILAAEAARIHAEDAEMCAAIGRNGAGLIRDGARVLTHCNAGALATGGSGTALAIVYEAVGRGKRVEVYADETRPLLQGARITAYELKAAGVPVTVLCDGAAASLMAASRVDLVLVGADRIAANGDAANKIGTLQLAIAARHYGVPFYVAAPASTFDLSLPDGGGIRIEHRPAEEVAVVAGRRVVPDGVSVYNPAFDVTPAELITAIITERGVLRPPYRQSIADMTAR